MALAGLKLKSVTRSKETRSAWPPPPPPNVTTASLTTIIESGLAFGEVAFWVCF